LRRCATRPTGQGSSWCSSRGGTASSGSVLRIDEILHAVRDFAASCGEVFASYEAQDSGCVSFGVQSGNRRWFIKGPRDDAAAETVASAIEFHDRVRHAVIVRPVEVVEVSGFPVLRYPWVDGETLYPATVDSRGPQVRGQGSAHERFRRLPVDQIVFAVDAVFSAHVEVAREGFVAIDLYDGCLHYDFDRRRMRLVDLDEYRMGPVAVPSEGLPGSKRFRSPEELTPGATLDERSTVYTLGRVAQILLDAGDDTGEWRASRELEEVASQATAPRPGDRYASVAELAAVWRAAASIAD
jgi:serine/threonine-protein kinase